MNLDTSYSTYSSEPAYIAANTHLLSHLPNEPVHTVLDLACGTALFSRLLLAGQADCQIVGMDISTESLDIGRRLLTEEGLLASSAQELAEREREKRNGVWLREHSADELDDFAEDSVDLVIMGNAIHLLPDKPKLLRGILRVLKPGGRFAFNSVFFKGTIPPEAEALFADWMREAVLHVQSINAERLARGEAQIPRVRGQGGRAFTKGWMSGQEWSSLMGEIGFQPIEWWLHPSGINEECLAAVGAYKGLSEVLMSGYPLDVASEALAVGAHRLFAQRGIRELPRLWLEVVGQKPF